jgi:epoxyqueuosine reductase
VPEAPLHALATAAAPFGLMTMGALHDAGRTLILLGTDSGFWDVFTTSPEATDGQADPINRYSERVLANLATQIGADDVAYPFGGPPYTPFIAWAKATGEAFDSPTGMLVHIKAGMMISYRGAVVFDGLLGLPATTHANPCDTCAARPCEAACPVGALSKDHFYDVPACKSYLATDAGQSCMTQGCAVRLACPVSQQFARPTAQSAYHMTQFKGA